MTPIEERLYHDALTMALRLYGEDYDTMGPDCMEVMDRWRPECERAFQRVADFEPETPTLKEILRDLIDPYKPSFFGGEIGA